MDIKNRINEIIDRHNDGVIQFLNQKEIPAFLNVFLEDWTKTKYVKPITVDYKLLGGYSRKSLILAIISELDNNDTSVVSKVNSLIHEEETISTISKFELAEVISKLLGDYRRGRLITLVLKDENINIDFSIFSLLDDLLHLPLHTRAQWCVVTSVRELMVLFGLLSPEEYYTDNAVPERHININNLTSPPIEVSIKINSDESILPIYEGRIAQGQQIRIGNATHADVPIKGMEHSIDFVIHQCECGGLILANLSQEWSVSLVQQRAIVSNQTILAKPIKQHIPFLEVTVQVPSKIDIVFPNQRLYITVNEY